MKTKAYVKQGSYQRSSKKINGALDVNKEVLDTLVDKGLINTEDCCTYSLGLGVGTAFFSTNAGSVVVNDTRIKENSLVFVSQASSENSSIYSVDPNNYVPGESFVIVRYNNTGSARTVNYFIINP